MSSVQRFCSYGEIEHILLVLCLLSDSQFGNYKNNGFTEPMQRVYIREISELAPSLQNTFSTTTFDQTVFNM